MNDDADVADVLIEAAQFGEFPFLVNHTKHYDLVYHEQLLARDDKISNYTTTARDPLMIRKAQQEAKCMLSFIITYLKLCVKCIFR